MLCVLHWERTSKVQAIYRRCFLIPVELNYCYWVPATKASWSDIHQFSVLDLHQSSLLRLIKCIVHQSPVLHLPRVLRQSTLLRLLQVHRSPISSVTPSTRVAPISTVAPSTSVASIVTVALPQLHRSTVAPFLQCCFFCWLLFCAL